MFKTAKIKMLPLCIFIFLTSSALLRGNCDTARIGKIMSQGYQEFETGKMSDAFKLFTEARTLLSNGCEIKIPQVYLALARYYIAIGDNKTAEPFADSCILYSERFNDQDLLHDAYIRKGNILMDNGQFDKTLELFYKSLKYFERTGNTRRTVDCLQRIGLAFKRQGRWEDALSHYRKARVIAIQRKDYNQLTSLLNNFASLKYQQGQKDSAVHYFKLAEESSKNSTEKKLYLKIKTNIATLYIEQGKFEEGKKSLEECMEIAKREGDLEMETTILINLGDLNKLQKNHKQAITYYEAAYERVTKLNNLNIESHVLEGLVKSHDQLKNYEQAFHYLKMARAVKDSLEQQKNSKRTVELKLQNEYERKTLADSLKTAEEKKVNEIRLREEKTKKNYLYAGIGLLIIVLLVILNRFKITQKQKVVIESQKKEVEAQKHIVDVKQKEILDSITYAKRIQNAIIPSKSTLKKHFENHFLFYKPKDIVAGDFCWFETYNDIKLVAVADCTGHGVPGALVSVVCSNALNRAVKEFRLSKPSDILNKTRDIVLEAFAMSDETINDGMDISLCSIKENAGGYEIQWAGANNSLWYVKDSEFLEIKADKFPVGRAYSTGNFSNHTLELKKGDYIILYSDGFADQFGGDKGKKYKYKNLMTFIKTSESKGTAFSSLGEELEKEFDEWKGKQEQIDDVCVLGIKF